MPVEEHQLAFVDSIASNAAIRLDLNSVDFGGPWNLRDGSRFDPPPLKRAVPASLLADGGTPTAAVYDNRSILLQLQLLGPGGTLLAADAAAAQLQLLIRELSRPSNILRYQAGTSSPVFFRTYRSGPDAVDFEPTNREVTVTLLAEPFGYGLEETLSSVVVYNDPTEGAATVVNPNPFFETNTAGWVSSGATSFVRSTSQFHEGVASGLLTPTGAAGTTLAAMDASAITGLPSTTYRGSAWVRCGASRNVEIRLDYYDAGNVFLTNTVATVGVTNGIWQRLDVSGTSHASTAHIGLTLAMTGTPPAGHTLFIDEARVRLPAAGAAGGMCFDVTSPKGDVETPLFLTVSGGIGATGRLRSGLAVRRRGTVSATPLVVQAESMTQGTDTATSSFSSAMSGAGNNFSRTTFATNATMQQRLSTGTRFPATASVDARGIYRVFARVRQNTSAAVIDMRLLWGSTNATITNDTVRMPVDTGPGAPTIKYVDLGLIQIPNGYDPVYDGLTGVELATEGVFLSLQIQRVSGSGSVDTDLLLFWPADDRSEFIKWPEFQAFTSDTFVAEGGPGPAAYCLNLSGQLSSTQAIEIAGGGMMITPGRTNRIFFARDLGTGTALTGAGDDVTANLTLTPSYFPRYLFQTRPATT